MPLERLNFDIVIVIITIFCMIFGFYYSLRRETKKAINLILSVVITHFSSTVIVRKLLFIDNLKNSLYKLYLIIVRFLKVGDMFEIHFYFAVAMIEIILVYYLLSLLLKFFDKKTIKRVVEKEEITSRIIASILSVIQGYIYSVLVLVFLGGIININYQTPITKFVQESSSNISIISGYNRVRALCEEKEQLSKELDIIYGERILEIYDDICNGSSEELISFKESLQKDINEYSLKEILDLYCEYFSNDKMFSNDINSIHLFYSLKKVIEKAYDFKIDDSDVDEYSLKLKNLEKTSSDYLKVLKEAISKSDFECLERYLNKFARLEVSNLDLVDKLFKGSQKTIDKITSKNVLAKTYINKIYSLE